MFANHICDNCKVGVLDKIILATILGITLTAVLIPIQEVSADVSTTIETNVTVDISAMIETKITAKDIAADDFFGKAVALDGNRMIVGAVNNGNNVNSGSAYIYELNGADWVETAKITASDGAANDNFGESVALDGDRVLVGAFRDGDNGINSGSAYIYELNGADWVETAKITASDGAANDNFGESVALDGDRVLVGAVNNGNNVNSGSAYIYELNGADWVETAKITASDGEDRDQFGKAVALDGNRVLIGVYRDNNGNNVNSGSAYIYELNGADWVETAKITASDGAGGTDLVSQLHLMVTVQ